MAKKEKSAAQKIERLRKDIVREVTTWKSIRENGCNDPFWTDGCNMNLTRNHIIYDKYLIQELCEESGAELPEEYYIPTPPETDNSYMAKLKQKARVERLIQFGNRISRKAPEYDSEQINIFDLWREL